MDGTVRPKSESVSSPPFRKSEVDWGSLSDNCNALLFGIGLSLIAAFNIILYRTYGHNIPARLLEGGTLVYLIALLCVGFLAYKFRRWCLH